MTSWINNRIYFRTLEANNLSRVSSSNFCRGKGSVFFRMLENVPPSRRKGRNMLVRGTDTNGIHGIPGPLMRPMINRWQYFKRWLPRPRSYSYFCQQHRAVSQEDVPFPPSRIVSFLYPFSTRASRAQATNVVPTLWFITESITGQALLWLSFHSRHPFPESWQRESPV